MRIVVVAGCVVLAGCDLGFALTPVNGLGGVGPDAGVGTGSGSGVVDAAPPASACLAAWMNGTVKLATPAVLANQSNTFEDERDPWVSSDGLRLYYTFAKVNGNSDVYMATRKDSNPVTPFGAGATQTNLNTTHNDLRPALTADEKVMVFTSDRDTGSQFNIEISTRSDATSLFPTPTPGDPRVANVNGTTLGASHFDPFLSADGLRLYFAPALPGQHLAMASRSDVNSDFSSGQLLDAINSTSDLDADPAVSLDERVIVFSSNRAGGLGGIDLWYATRATPSQDFGTPKPIPTVNSTATDGDPMLSADGCTLYFSSARGASATYDLYSATVIL